MCGCSVNGAHIAATCRDGGVLADSSPRHVAGLHASCRRWSQHAALAAVCLAGLLACRPRVRVARTPQDEQCAMAICMAGRLTRVWVAAAQVLLMFGPEYARACGQDAPEPLGIALPDKNYPGAPPLAACLACAAQGRVASTCGCNVCRGSLWLRLRPEGCKPLRCCFACRHICGKAACRVSLPPCVSLLLDRRECSGCHVRRHLRLQLAVSR